MRDQALWTWHLIAGAVTAIFLGLHMGIMHLDAVLGIFNAHGGHPIDWENVVARAQSVGFTITYIILLGAALFHGLYGLRNILFELNPTGGTKRAISTVLIVGGLGLFALGTWSAIVGFQHAARAL